MDPECVRYSSVLALVYLRWRCPVRTAIDVIFTMTFHIKLYIYIGMNEYYTIYSSITVISILESGDITFYGVFFNIIHYWHQSISHSIPCVFHYETYIGISPYLCCGFHCQIYIGFSPYHTLSRGFHSQIYISISPYHTLCCDFYCGTWYCYQSISQYVGSVIFTLYVSMPSSYDFQ